MQELIDIFAFEQLHGDEEDAVFLVDVVDAATGEGLAEACGVTHYSTMGYQGNDATTQARDSAPAIAASMKREEVDLALLAPV